jgi:hypothetical protein
MSALKLAVHIGLDEIRGHEFCAMLPRSGICRRGKGCRLQGGLVEQVDDLDQRGSMDGLVRLLGRDELVRVG